MDRSPGFRKGVLLALSHSLARTPSRKLISRTKKEDHMAQPTPAIHTVQPGDSLFAIAQHFYGDGNQWHRIYDYCNKQVIGQDPNLIRPGEVLYIPPNGTPAIHTVQPGDSLFAIAQHFYGDGNQWHRIYDYCNKQGIGQDPNLIR